MRRMEWGPGRRRAFGVWVLSLSMPLALGSVCEGSGTNRPGAITQGPIDARCAPIGGLFPSGFDWLPGPLPHAVTMRFSNPAGLLRFDLSTVPPTPANGGPVPPLPADSDGDGVADYLGFQQAGLCPARLPTCITSPIPGAVEAAFSDVVLVTTSGYEQVLFIEPDTSAPTWLEVSNPPDGGAHRATDRPLYPAGGTSALRTALSTSACAYPPSPVDSAGAAIAPSPHCDPGRTGILTRFTAATAVVDGRLFVATSNLVSPATGTFQPGTVLVHDLELAPDGRPTRVTPDVATPVVYTTHFNPTGLTAHRTATGRDVVLVTQTGAIDGSGALLTDAAIDVIDAASARVVATVPLGRAGAAFGELAIDRGGHVALIGAESSRQLYAVDLSALDDSALYAPRATPVVLDGSTAGFGDARIFYAGAPFTLPRRPDGPSDALCTSRTNVTLSHSGELAYVTDWCDGAISVVAIDWTLPLEAPLSPTRFSVARRLDVLAPKTPANFGLATAPSLPRTRAGVPGIDFDGPDLFFIVNEPEGQLCGARVEL